MFRLRVISDKLNIRNTPVADPEFANWIGDSLKDELLFAEKKIKGGLFEGVDDWYVDEQQRFYWAGGVVEIPLPLTKEDIEKFESIASFPNEKIEWNDRFDNLPSEIKLNKGIDVRIALLDSGIDQKHVDLAGSVYGMCDFTNSPAACNDVINHGTLMASLLCAKGFFPDKGIRGICSQASLIVAKVVYERNDPEDYKSYADGIAFAVSHGADVINLSIGTTKPDDIPLVSEEIVKASMQDVIMVASTKQINFPINELMQYPANHPKVIAVAAVSQSYFETNRNDFPRNLIITPRIRVSGAVIESKKFYGSDLGSSVGTALISGFIALMAGAGKLEKRDKQSVLDLLANFQSTPEKLFDRPNNFLIIQ